MGSLISELSYLINKISIPGWLGVLGERTKKYEGCQWMPHRLQKQHSLKKSALKTVVDTLVRHFEVPKIGFCTSSYFFVRARGHSKAIRSMRFRYKSLGAEINDPKGHTHASKFTIDQRFSISFSPLLSLETVGNMIVFNLFDVSLSCRLVVSLQSIFGHRYC